MYYNNCYNFCIHCLGYVTTVTSINTLCEVSGHYVPYD